MATTVAANVNEMSTSEFCSVRRTRGISDFGLAYVDATDTRESSRGAIYLIGDAQLAPRLGAATWRDPLLRPNLRRCSLHTCVCSARARIVPETPNRRESQRCQGLNAGPGAELLRKDS